MLRVAYAIASEQASLRKAYPGVYKKCHAQADVFLDAGLDCHLLFVGKKNGLSQKALSRLPFVSDGVNWDLLNDNQYDVVYIRRPNFVSFDLIRCLRRIKRNPNSIILLEIPTYPYVREYLSLSGIPVLFKDIFHRRKLREYVDGIVDLSGHRLIFGVPTLQIINGIDLSEVVPRSPAALDADGFDMMCAASFVTWHGMDRLIAGMRDYKEGGGARKIRLHLLGIGDALPSLERQVAKSGLGEEVAFHGRCDRAQMDAVYDRCSFAIECLGCHRQGVSLSSSLKSREYLAKGMPFVYSGEIDVFREDPVDFCLRVPADESPIDIEALIGFSDRLYAREPQQALIGRIRAYAESHVGMDTAMKNVIDYIKENCADER